MSVDKKLKQYIKEDRPKKFQTYVLSHDIDVNEVVLSRGWGLLHYCIQHGSADMLRCLLKLDCVPDLQDKKGNLPLHLAALRALNEETVESRRELLEKMVIPLLKAYPLGRDVENRDGVTGYDLVSAVKYKVKAESQTDEEVERQRERIMAEEEEMWQRKLAQEMNAEFEEQNPRYDYEEDMRTEEQTETAEEWRERIRREMYQRQQQAHHHKFHRDDTHTHDKHTHKKHKHRKSSRREKLEEEQRRWEDEEERLRRAREEMRKRFKPPPPSSAQPERLVDRKQRYETKFSHLLKNLTTGRTLTFGCVPWPHTNLDLVSTTLFCDLPDKSSGAYKKYLRAQQIRWHPDKFTQKFGEHLHPDHVKKIMTRVKNISQLLNKLASSLQE